MEQDIDTQIDTTDASDVHENASTPLSAIANGTSSRPGNQQAACVSEDEVYVRQRNKLKARLEQAARKIRRRHKERLRDARDARDRSQRAADKQFEVDNQRLSEAFSCRAEICALQRQAVEELRAELSLVVQDSPGVFSSVEKSPAMEDETSPPRRRFAKSIRQARRELANVRGYLRFRAKLRAASIGAFLALAVLFGVTAGLLLQWSGWIWISSAALSGPVAALAVGYALIVRPSHKKGQRAYQNCCEAVSAAQAAVDALYASTQSNLHPRLEAAAQRREQAHDQAARQWKQTADTLRLMRDKRLNENKEKVQERRQKLDAEYDRRVAELAKQPLPPPQALANDAQQSATQLLQWQDERLAAAENGSCNSQ